MIQKLPPAPSTKTGWPWTGESWPLPATMENGNPWPKVSIVTPSYNQGQFLEETIRSVLLQNYPNLEYIIIDGGSTDGSVGIIKKYERWLTYWVSEKDRGQSHAINKGFKLANGEIIAWLNSDDVYYPNALSEIIDCFLRNQDSGLIYGYCDLIDENGAYLRTKGGEWDYKRLLRRTFFGQPATFINKKILGLSGDLDESLSNALDWELWVRIGLFAPGTFLPVPLAKARMWSECKTLKFSGNANREHMIVLKNLKKQQSAPEWVRPEISRVLAYHYWKQGEHEWKGKSRFSALVKFVLAFQNAPIYCMSNLLYNRVVERLPMHFRNAGVAVKQRWRHFFDR